MRRFGVALDSADLAKIAAMHAEFMETGLALRLTTFNRPLRLDYPTYRDLLLETDAQGQRAGYLVGEAGFRYVQQLQRELNKALTREVAVTGVFDKATEDAVREFQRLSDEMDRKAKEKTIDGATLAYLRLTMNCVNCHKYVRQVAK